MNRKVFLSLLALALVLASISLLSNKAEAATCDEGHQFGNYEFDNLDHWQVCKVCGEKGEVLPHRLIERTEDQKRIIYCSCGYTEEEDITDPGESDPSDHEQNPLAKLLENLLDSVKNMTETTALVVFIVIGLAGFLVVAAIALVIVKLLKRKRKK